MLLILLTWLSIASATLAPEDIPASCNALIESTGKSAVTYLANVAAKLDDDKCKQSCVSSICGASIVDAAAGGERVQQVVEGVVGGGAERGAKGVWAYCRV